MKRASHGGPPPSFLDYRRRQLHLALRQAGVDLAGTAVLEIGGGVSGQADELARLASRVVCSDLLESTSSYGGDFARAAVLAESSAGQLSFVCARGECLPFRDGSFDVVYSSYVFEHIADRVGAAREIARVLREGGVAITNVPNTMEPVLRAFWVYLLDLPKHALKALLVWSGVARVLKLSFASEPPPLSEFSRVRGWMTGLLRHPPHGEYRNRLEEIALSRPKVWNETFEAAGLVVERSFTICLDYYVPPVSIRVTALAQALLAPVLRRFGHTRAATRVGASYCFVSRKLT